MNRFPAPVAGSQARLPAGSVLRAVVLGGVAGWYHPAAGDRGVVIAGAQGYEDLCARSALTDLARDLATAGLPVFRFDWRGTGESLDLAADDDPVAAWTGDLDRAVDFMRATTGVHEVVVVGFRFGALIAASFAARNPVDRLVLLAPPAGGRGWVREQTILARIVDGSIAPAGGDLEVAGFRLSAAARDGLSGIDLTRPTARPAPRVLIVAEEGSAALDRVAESLRAAGAGVERAAFDGYARLMCDPTASEPPTATFARLAAWIATPPAVARMPMAGGDVPRHRPPAHPHLVGDDFEEEALIFADGLVGVLTRPRRPADPRRAAIILDSGRNHRIGWGGQSVALARRLAGTGVSVLRFDFAGIGDSPARAGAPRAALYHADGIADVTAALDEMQRRGHDRLTLIGACSGAHQAFHAARTGDPRITGLVLVNTLCFVWSARYALHLSAWMRARPHEFDAERRSASDAGSTAPGILAGLIGLARRIARPIVAAWRKSAHGAATGLVEAAFRDFAARGLAVSVVLSDGDRAVEEFELHTGPGGERVAGLPGLTILRLPDADHSLTPRAARRALADHVVERLAPAPEAGLAELRR
jgi:alpha-beta hydrolase superfamily lysophospholipase